MTTFRDLPEEVQHLIFANLNKSDLLNCQYTCRLWYLPTHILLLKDIHLKDLEQVESFIASIDRNPDPLYLKAVKSLKITHVGNGDNIGETVEFDEEGYINLNSYRGNVDLPNPIDSNKLFFRFPKLRKVEAEESLVIFQGFTETMCETFIKCCPQLDTFSVVCDREKLYAYCPMLYTLRSLITRIDPITTYHIQDFGEFIRSFPRLKTIDGSPCKAIRFEGWLAIFAELPNLTEINLQTFRDDREDLIQYMQSEQKLVTRLSEISKLTWNSRPNINSLKFITKYMTGLTHFALECHDIKFTEDDAFSDMVLKLASSVDKYSISPIFVDGYILLEPLPIMIKKVFCQPSPTCRNVPKRILQYRYASDFALSVGGLLTLHVKSNLRKSKQIIEIRYSGQVDTVHSLLDTSFAMDCVDEFILILKLGISSGFKIDLEWYEKVFELISPFKKITIDVPSYFKEAKSNQKTTKTYPQIQDLTLRASPDEKFQSLLDRCCSAFPNLKLLGIYYYCGVWKEDVGEFQLDLANYSLEQLTVDLTPVRAWYIEEQKLTDNAFFIVKVYLSSSNEQCLFKVPLCRTKSAILISNSDLEDKDYKKLLVHITLTNVEVLKFCMYHDEWVADGDDYWDTRCEYLDESMDYVTCSTFKLHDSV